MKFGRITNFNGNFIFSSENYTSVLGENLLGSSYVENGNFGGEYGAVITTVCPIDDTIPQLSEGQVILTTPSYTTKSATSKLRITAHVNVTPGTANYASVVHIHRDNNADAESVARQATNGTSYPQNIDMMYQVSSPGAGVSLTYKVVVGTQSGTNTQVNGYNGSRYFGGKLLSTLLVEEIEDSSSYSTGVVLLESKYISSNTQSIVFSGLDGDTDKFYKLIMIKKNGVNDTTYAIKPNESASNTSMISHNSRSDSIHAVTVNSSGMSVGLSNVGLSEAETQYSMVMDIAAKSGEIRWFNWHASYSSGTTWGMTSNVGRWTDTSTNLTSLEISGNQLDSFTTGSELHLYKINTA